jgi:thymidylate kinase
MSKLIIIEGPDSTGKSSLAKFMAREMRSVYVHASGDKSLHDEMLRYHQTLLTDAKVNLDNGLNVIMDRHWPSEWCYGRILRPHLADRYGFKYVEEMLLHLEPIYIFCHSATAFERHFEIHKQEDHSYTRDDFKKIVDEYRKLHMQVLDESLHGLRPRQVVLEYSIEKHGHDLKTFTDFVMKQ